MKRLSQGVLISVEGIDGSGKSTLVANLSKAFGEQITPLIVTKEPGGTALGKQLRSILQEQPVPVSTTAEYLMFAADRAQHFQEFIIPLLNNNALIISDRMADSSLVYQGFGRGLDASMLTTINQWAMQGRQPDCTLYVKITPELAYERLLKRGKLTALEESHKTFFHTLARGFDTLFEDRDNIIVLDGSLTPEEVLTQAMHSITAWLTQRALLS